MPHIVGFEPKSRYTFKVRMPEYPGTSLTYDNKEGKRRGFMERYKKGTGKEGEYKRAQKRRGIGYVKGRTWAGDMMEAYDTERWSVYRFGPAQGPGK